MKRHLKRLFFLATITAFATGQPGFASVIVAIADTGSDVSVTALGSINLAALTNNVGLVLTDNGGFLDFGAAVGTTQGLLTRGGLYNFMSGPTFTGPAYPFFGAESPSQRQIFFSSESGDKIGLGYNPNFGGQVGIALATDYVSRRPISASGVWANKEFSDLGLTAGTSFTWTWGSGASADFFTINVNQVPEPSSTLLICVAAGGLVAFGCRRRTKRP